MAARAAGGVARAGRALSLTSFFFNAGFGMKGFEPLARASAFVLPVEAAARGEDAPASFHIVTVKHITHPHRTSYFDDTPFVQLLDDEDVRVTVEVRDDAGRIVSRHPLRQRMFPHPYRDLTVAHVEREHEEAFARALKAANIGLCTLYTDDVEQGIVRWPSPGRGHGAVGGSRTTTSLAF